MKPVLNLMLAMLLACGGLMAGASWVPPYGPSRGGVLAAAAQDAGTVDFGDDTSVWARDGQCDDPRFIGEGVAKTQLDSDTHRDATDCRALSNLGLIQLRAAPVSGTVASHVERGRLDVEDETLATGEFVDIYILEGCAGDKAVLDLRSAEFDPYLIIRTPSGEQLYNDDHEGDRTRSLLAVKLDQTASYTIGLTSVRQKTVTASFYGSCA